MLNGSKTFLRIPDLSDVSFMLAIENDERYWHLSGNTSPYSNEDLARFVLESSFNLEADHQLRLVIIEIESKKRAGLIDLFEFDSINKRVGIGIFIHEDFRRKGLATDAMLVLIQYLFEILQLHQIWGNVLTNNVASTKLFTDIGFEKTCIKKEWIFFDEQYCDEALFQLFNNTQKT